MTASMPRKALAVGSALLSALVLAAAAACSRGPEATYPRGKDESLSTAQLLEKGRSLLERRRFYRARVSLEKVLSRQDATREMLADVNLLIADAYFHDGGIINLAEALSRYTSFLTFYPTHPKSDYAQYQLGLSYLKQALGPEKDQSTTRKALEAFREVERQHPASDWVIPAEEQIRKCRERLAEAEMRVGLFYVKRSAWRGAIARFRTILEEYPLYSRTDRAYFELARALEESNRPDEAIIYFKRILEKFPGSRYAPDARQAVERKVGLEDRTAEAGEKSDSSRRGDATPKGRGQGEI